MTIPSTNPKYYSLCLSVKFEHAMKDINCLLPHSPERAFALLGHISCDEQRQTLARAIAHSWSRKDITIAWNTVALSSLDAADKQIMFNELWS